MQSIMDTLTKTTTMSWKFHLILWPLLRLLWVLFNYTHIHLLAHPAWLQDYAILQNLIHDNNTVRSIEFSTPVLEDVFRGHMVRLFEWRNKKPAVYRRFMHRQFKDIM
jgi:hypothetical protein